MALTKVFARQIHCKIAYYGSEDGVDANLKYICHALPFSTGNLPEEFAKGIKPAFCITLPELGLIPDFQINFHLYNASNQRLDERAKVVALAKADGLVFVADSQPHQLDQNVKNLKDLTQYIRAQGRKFLSFPPQVQEHYSIIRMPLVLQYNNCDAPDALPLEVLDHQLNSDIKVPSFPANTNTDEGVFDTLKAICKIVVSRL
jgi:mutual gliding-motility protein MglA